MHQPKSLLFFSLIAALWICQPSTFAETPEERRAQWDQGPQVIDVSQYPTKIQEDYAVFAQRCKKCHNLARPVNCDYVLPGEWERYIKRMMRKPGSGISGADGKQIYEFLVYDASVRKSDIQKEKLGALSDEERKRDEVKMAEVRSRYAQ